MNIKNESPGKIVDMLDNCLTIKLEKIHNKRESHWFKNKFDLDRGR